MRAVVIATKGSKAAVAFKGGELKYIDDMGYERGQILDIPYEEDAFFSVTEGKKRTRASFFGFSSSVAAAASVLLLTGAVTAYALPVSTVTIDLNPSLSMGINIFDRIVSADYANEDGEELLHDISPELMGKKLPDAVNIVFDGMEEKNYINGKDIPAASTVDSLLPGGRKIRVMEELRSSADHWNSMHKDHSVSFEVEPMTPDLRKEAHDKGMTPGQVMLNRNMPEEKPYEALPEIEPEKEEAVPKDNSIQEDSIEPPKDNSVRGDSVEPPRDNNVQGDNVEPPKDKGGSGDSDTLSKEKTVPGNSVELPEDNNVPGDNATPPPEGFSPGNDKVAPPEGSSPGNDTVAPPEGSSPGNDTVAPPEGSSPGNDTVAPPEGSSPGNDTIAPPEGFSSGNDTITPPEGFSPGNDMSSPPDGFAPGNDIAPPSADSGSDSGNNDHEDGGQESRDSREDSGNRDSGRDRNPGGDRKSGGPGGPGKK